MSPYVGPWELDAGWTRRDSRREARDQRENRFPGNPPEIDEIAIRRSSELLQTPDLLVRECGSKRLGDSG
jgi:hypothetical protein